MCEIAFLLPPGSASVLQIHFRNMFVSRKNVIKTKTQRNNFKNVQTTTETPETTHGKTRQRMNNAQTNHQNVPNKPENRKQVQKVQKTRSTSIHN